MLTKSQPDEMQSFLGDSSHIAGGFAERVVFPETVEDVAEVLGEASQAQTPVTISGAGTGTVAGRVPFGGIVLATDKLNRIKEIAHDDYGGARAIAEAGVILGDFQRAVESEGLLYPPDPTERSCFLGGTVATNASGARTFKYGPTRNYVERLKIALATGEVIDIRRGETRADTNGKVTIPLPSGRLIETHLPTYRMPRVRKHACGYYVAPGMDVIDLFIGSEGTLGVILEVEAKLLAKPEGLLSGVVFFKSEEDLLAFVREARERSLANRGASPTVREGSAVDARALEYFDIESLRFLRQKYPKIPNEAIGAIFFEQETTSSTEDSSMNEWLSLLERHNALADDSWFATNEADQAGLREFRHALPVLMNEWFARHNQRKVSTDMAVPDEAFAGMLRFYQDSLRGGNLRYTIFGHIGDNHVHVNILPRNDEEAARSWEIYRSFIRRAVEVGGTISAEHGIGKLKREYLRELYGDEHLREMAALKHAFDPRGILGRGNMFPDLFLT
ncbi:MAG TPA: FAD-binding oxidoreductase [Pyrinomonadaceae bacterium]|nr:FAD-binding oxidoreductase [Pyrinomonadaceae bacterium]